MAVSLEEFKRIELRIGKIVEVVPIKESEKLYKMTVDFGDEKRVAVAGLRKYYEIKDLEGRKFLFITNLEHKKIMGIESECMILAAEDKEGNLSLLVPDREIAEGSRIR